MRLKEVRTLVLHAGTVKLDVESPRRLQKRRSLTFELDGALFHTWCWRAKRATRHSFFGFVDGLRTSHVNLFRIALSASFSEICTAHAQTERAPFTASMSFSRTVETAFAVPIEGCADAGSCPYHAWHN